jgi:hypothetical protein
MGDEDAYLRVYAALAVHNLTGDTLATVPVLATALADDDAFRAAARAIEHIGPTAGREPTCDQDQADKWRGTHDSGHSSAMRDGHWHGVVGTQHQRGNVPESLGHRKIQETRSSEQRSRHSSSGAILRNAPCHQAQAAKHCRPADQNDWHDSHIHAASSR